MDSSLIQSLVSIELGRFPLDISTLIEKGLARQVIIDPPRYILTRDGRALLHHLRDSSESGIVDVVSAIMSSVKGDII